MPRHYRKPSDKKIVIKTYEKEMMRYLYSSLRSGRTKMTKLVRKFRINKRCKSRVQKVVLQK